MNFFRNTALQLLTSVAGIPLGIATSVVLARYLSVDDRGTLALLTSFATVIVIVNQLGWPSASIYRLRRAKTEPAKVAGAGLYACLLISALSIAVCLVFREPISEHFLSGIPAGLYFIALLLVPFQLLARIFKGIARGIDRFALQNVYRIALSVGTLAAAVSVLILWRQGLRSIAIGLLVVEVVTAFWLVGGILRQTGLALRVDVAEAMASLRFGLKSYAQSLTGEVHERIDLFMLAFFLADSEQVAYYAIAYGVTQRVQLVPEAIGTSLFPKLAGLKDTDAGKFASQVSRHSLVWVIATVAALGIGGPFLIPLLYGSEYVSSVGPFLVLLPAVGALTIYRVLGRYFIALGRQEVAIGTQITSTIVNILLNIWLIPKHGAIGAATASLISYTLEAVLITIVFLRSSGRGVSETFLFRGADLRPYRERLERLKSRNNSR